MNSAIKKKVSSIGLPRIIIAVFLFSLYVLAPFVGISLKTALDRKSVV